MRTLTVVTFLISVAVNGITGRHLDASQDNVRIIDGQDVDITQYPHQVNLLLGGAPNCGGSIISEQYVLTAGHCLEGSPGDYQVRAGSTYLTEGGELYNVQSIASHPNYNKGTDFDYDVAVARVAGSIKIDGVKTKIVKLAFAGSALTPGQMVTVTGWGNTNAGTPSNTLKVAMLPVVDHEDCKVSWPQLTDRMLCAGATKPGPATCQGDSGGPLIDNSFVQYGIVSFGPPGCQGQPTVFASVANLRSWIQQTTGVASYVSVLTIVAFSLERYLAICHPLHLYAMAGLRRALRIVAALWALSLLAASPFAMYTTVSYHDYPPGSGNASVESAFCAMLELPSWYLCELSSLLFFILPGIIILCLYVRMGLRIRSTHTNKPGSPGTLNGVNGSVHGEARQAQSRKAIIRMLAAVVVAFFVCWAPFHFQRLFFIYGAGSRHYHTINKHLFSVAGAFYYVSATVNPILYNVMSHRYRIAFRETLCCGHVQRKQSKYYREHSSIRETTVNHTSEGTHLVRVRSQSHDRRNRVEHKAFRRSSYYGTETTALCDKWKQDYYKEGINRGSLMRSERNSNNSSPCNNNESSQVLFNEKEFEREYKDHEDDDSININISIHLHK